MIGNEALVAVLASVELLARGDSSPKSKKHVKAIARHVWEADHIRHTDEWKKIYPQRKETIERVFADAKENHGMRFTRLKGLVKNQHESLIIFSCHNLKKLGSCKQRMGLI